LHIPHQVAMRLYLHSTLLKNIVVHETINLGLAQKLLLS